MQSEKKNHKLSELRGNAAKNIAEQKNTKVIITFLKLAVFAVIIIGVPLFIFINYADRLQALKSLEDVTKLLSHYQTMSVFVYIAFQIIQIVICFIPGQFLQIAAGYLFGFIPSLFYSVIGAGIGSSLSYGIARFLGRDAVHLFISKEKVSYYVALLNSKKAYMITFLIFLIPGLPKDIMGYAAGLSDMKFKAFILISVVGRVPAMCGSILVGAFYKTGNYVGLAAVIGAVIAVLIVCALKRKSLTKYLDSVYEKISK